YAGVVAREGPEADAESFVLVLVLNQEDGGAADVVGQGGGRPVEDGAFLPFHQGIAGVHSPRGGVLFLILHVGSPYKGVKVCFYCTIPRRERQSTGKNPFSRPAGRAFE